MNYNPETNIVHCHVCDKDRDLDKNTLVIDYGSNPREDDHVICIHCFAHLGYRKDVPKWQKKEDA